MLSWSSLEYNEIGLDYSGVTLVVRPVTYTSGLYLLGVGHSFLTFPKTVQTMELSNDYAKRSYHADNEGASLKSRTKDGLEVVLEISF